MYQVWALPADLAWLARSYDGPDSFVRSGRAIGAFVDGQMAATACVFFQGERYDEVGIATLPAFRGGGLATACAVTLCEDIRARGRVPCWSTSEDNLASLRVAQKVGFRPASRGVLYVTGPANAPHGARPVAPGS